MNRVLTGCWLGLCLAGLGGCGEHGAPGGGVQVDPAAMAMLQPANLPDDWRQPLFEGLGDLHFPITTASAEAQAYFDQGLMLAFAFNHAAVDARFDAAWQHADIEISGSRI